MSFMFGTCCGYPDKLRQYAIPGVQRSMDEPYSYIVLPSNGKSIFPVYRELLAVARSRKDIDFLVLLHDDLELRDTAFADKVRRTFEWHPDAAILGCIGSTGARSLYWWEGVCQGYCVDGRGGHHVTDFGIRDGRVMSVDGQLLVLNRWAIDNLEIPTEYSGFHGYPEDMGMQAFVRGKYSVVTKLGLFHHSVGGYVGGHASFEEANQVFKQKWGYT